MSYASVEQAASYLGIANGTDDVLLIELLDRATAAIDTYTRRKFKADTNTTRVFDATPPNINGPVLYFDRDCAAIATVTNGDGVVVSASEYVTMPRNEAPYYGIKLKDSSNKAWTYSTDWENAISVSAKWGYSVEPPDDIVQACVRYAAFMYRQKDAAFLDVTAIDAGVAIRPMNMPGDVRQLLGPYRRL